MGNYDDIINLPHHVSDKRNRMSQRDRAAQFSPFAALTGYDEAVSETARLTDAKIELTEDMKDTLDRQMRVLSEHITENPEIAVTYFSPDLKKDGGEYKKFEGRLRRIDTVSAKLIFNGGICINAADVLSLECELFGKYNIN